MSDLETRLREEAGRADKAAQVIENPEFIRAMNEMEAHLVNKLKTEPNRELQARLTDQLQAVESVKKCLVKTIQTGHLAVRELKDRKWW